jgi:histidine triad (HIT) family protein
MSTQSSSSSNVLHSDNELSSDSCVFCKIIAGIIPCSKVAETELSLAFLDINPVNHGHTLIIPKKHVSNLLALDEQHNRDIFDLAQKLAKALVFGLNYEGYNILSNQGAIAGQEVFHHHIHIVPRAAKGESLISGGKPYSSSEQRESIRSQLAATVSKL